MVRVKLAGGLGAATEHGDVRPTVRVVLLAVVGRELVLVLQERVLVPLRSTTAVGKVAGCVPTRSSPTALSR